MTWSEYSTHHSPSNSVHTLEFVVKECIVVVSSGPMNKSLACLEPMYIITQTLINDQISYAHTEHYPIIFQEIKNGKHIPTNRNVGGRFGWERHNAAFKTTRIISLSILPFGLNGSFLVRWTHLYTMPGVSVLVKR